jgi:hypothetical protein
MPAGVARDYSSYCGNYTFDGTRLVTRVRVGLAVGDLGHRVLREILPERVFGRPATTSAASKLAPGPMRSCTSATASRSTSARGAQRRL